MFKNANEISKLIDHTNLKPDAVRADLKQLCEEALNYNFKMVAINEYYTNYCSEILKGSSVNTGAAIAFPLGQTTIEAKVSETLDAIYNGANEIDYVLNVSRVKEGDYDYIREEMQRIVNVCRQHNVIVKVIFEICYLTDEEIVQLSKIASVVKPDFIKTSTGFGSGGATVSAVKLMSDHSGEFVSVKAAGGIRDLETLEAMVSAGASRIGTSSGIKIIEQFRNK